MPPKPACVPLCEPPFGSKYAGQSYKSGRNRQLLTQRVTPESASKAGHSGAVGTRRFLGPSSRGFPERTQQYMHIVQPVATRPSRWHRRGSGSSDVAQGAQPEGWARRYRVTVVALNSPQLSASARLRGAPGDQCDPAGGFRCASAEWCDPADGSPPGSGVRCGPARPHEPPQTAHGSQLGRSRSRHAATHLQQPSRHAATHLQQTSQRVATHLQQTSQHVATHLQQPSQHVATHLQQPSQHAGP